MANPIQQGLKPEALRRIETETDAAMANPIQQGLKHIDRFGIRGNLLRAAMANPIQQGLKRKIKATLRPPALSRNG